MKHIQKRAWREIEGDRGREHRESQERKDLICDYMDILFSMEWNMRRIDYRQWGRGKR